MSKTTKTTTKTAAMITVYQIQNMTDKGRRAVCGWMRARANEIEKHPEAFCNVFRARYLYEK